MEVGGLARLDRREAWVDIPRLMKVTGTPNRRLAGPQAGETYRPVA